MSNTTDIIDIGQFASLLGVSEKTARRNLKKWPHARIGRKIIFSRRAVMQKIAQPTPERAAMLRMRRHPLVDF